jgi:ribosome-associated toxin RatA of RatAB toxin-antitoxin module
MEHEYSTQIPVSPDRLYQAIADVGNLTRFVPPLKSVRRTDAEHVDVEASYEGHEQHGEAWFRADDDARKVEWGTEGHPYQGWMLVEPDGEGSKLTLHLSTPQVSDLKGYVTETFDSVRKLF